MNIRLAVPSDLENIKGSFVVKFNKLEQREKACPVLSNAGIRYRTGKTLVPLRLTGNIEWGVKAPKLEDEEDLTVWVWPESLWAPISFTRTYLKNKGFTIRKEEAYGDYVSLLPLSETVEQVTLTGFKYPVTNRAFKRACSLGISNEIVAEEAIVEFAGGIFIVVESRD